MKAIQLRGFGAPSGRRQIRAEPMTQPGEHGIAGRPCRLSSHVFRGVLGERARPRWTASVHSRQLAERSIASNDGDSSCCRPSFVSFSCGGAPFLLLARLYGVWLPGLVWTVTWGIALHDSEAAAASALALALEFPLTCCNESSRDADAGAGVVRDDVTLPRRPFPLPASRAGIRNRRSSMLFRSNNDALNDE